MESKRDDTFRRVFERLNPEALEQSLALILTDFVVIFSSSRFIELPL